MFRPSTVRELYVSERQFIDNTLTEAANNSTHMSTWLTPLRQLEQEQVETYKQKEFRKNYYTGGQKAPRRYFTHQAIAGFDMFAIYEQAHKAGQTNTFKEYKEFFLNTVPQALILRSILIQLFSLKQYSELKQIWGTPEWAEWVHTVSCWWVFSHIYNIWRGKKREEYLEQVVKTELQRWENVRMVKTSKEKDMTYMIDWVLLDDENVPLTGVSGKGASYEFTNSVYRASGEAREDKGHKAFTEATGGRTIVIISKPELPNNQGAKQIVERLRIELNQLEKENKITMKGKN